MLKINWETKYAVYPFILKDTQSTDIKHGKIIVYDKGGVIVKVDNMEDKQFKNIQKAMQYVSTSLVKN